MWVGCVRRDGFLNGFSFLAAILVFCVYTNIAQTFLSGTQRIWIQQVEIM